MTPPSRCLAGDGDGLMGVDGLEWEKEPLRVSMI